MSPKEQLHALGMRRRTTHIRKVRLLRYTYSTFTYEYPGLSFCDYHRCQYEEYVKYPNLPVSSESILTYPSLLLAYCVGWRSYQRWKLPLQQKSNLSPPRQCNASGTVFFRVGNLLFIQISMKLQPLPNTPCPHPNCVIYINIMNICPPT